MITWFIIKKQYFKGFEPLLVYSIGLDFVLEILLPLAIIFRSEIK